MSAVLSEDVPEHDSRCNEVLKLGLSLLNELYRADGQFPIGPQIALVTGYINHLFP